MSVHCQCKLCLILIVFYFLGNSCLNVVVLTAAGADYDSADDKNFDQSIDPHVLAKLKKMKVG